MLFHNEKGNVINHAVIESEEQRQAAQFIKPGQKVLELGARYGTVSCVVSTILNNPADFVTVEPDERVWNALEQNMLNNKCTFNIVKGVISRTPVQLEEVNSYDGYGTTSAQCASSNIPSFTLEEIEALYTIQFDTLIADCEGFLEIFFDENPKLYDQLSLVMFEKDYPNKCNYGKIKNTLSKKGFKQLINGFHEVWRKD